MAREVLERTKKEFAEVEAELNKERAPSGSPCSRS
jgi:hypothetical protein